MGLFNRTVPAAVVFIGEYVENMDELEPLKLSRMREALPPLVRELLKEDVAVSDNFIWFPFEGWASQAYPADMIQDLAVNGFSMAHLGGLQEQLFRDMDAALKKCGMALDHYHPACHVFPMDGPFQGHFLVCFKKAVKKKEL